ncbi:MAG: hypothetical protein ACT4PM_08650 [Gemmatimonadales bacterium]
MKVLRLGILALVLWTPVLSAQGGLAPMTKEQKISNAVTAAPASISAKATLLDWPASPGAQPAVLREGSNGWNCFPDFPATPGNDPMCIDATWLGLVNAMMQKKPPEVKQVGVGYMIGPDGAYGSNTDPYAEKETPDNEWGYDPPHIMLVFPSADALVGFSTDRKSGGPWVMWRGTPYAHVMVPIAPPAAKKP